MAGRGGKAAAAGDVELLAAGTDGDGVDGPATGEDAPLFKKGPEINCRFAIRKGALVVVFKAPVKAWELGKREGNFAVRLMAAHLPELPVARRGIADVDGEELDCGAKFSRKQGKLIVGFREEVKEWALPKNELKLALGYMRAELGALPMLKES